MAIFISPFVGSRNIFAKDERHMDVYSEMILHMGSGNERTYLVTPPLIGWVHTQNDPRKYIAVKGIASCSSLSEGSF